MSRHSSRCKLQKIRSHRSLVQLVQFACVNPQAFRHSSRSTSILSYRAAALACPACLLAFPALACALAAGLASAALAYEYGLRWQSYFTALAPALLRRRLLPCWLACLPCGLSCLLLAFRAACLAAAWLAAFRALLAAFLALGGWLASIRAAALLLPLLACLDSL